VLISAAVIHEEYPDVGDSLEAAIKREVSSDYRTLPWQRVQYALSLMRQDPQTALSPAVAREIALRDGQVSALLVPHVEQLGDAYVLSVEIIDPSDDQLLAYPSENIEDPREFLPAFERLAPAIRAGLSRIPARPREQRLPKVTTSSITALQMYAQAYRCLVDGQPMVAQEFLDLALDEDPDFASARMLQAWAQQRQGADRETYLQTSGEARDLSGRVSPAEQYFIEGSYRHLAGDLTRASASYRALLEIEPDHVFGAQAMLGLCLDSKSSHECVGHRVRLAQSRPDDFESNLQAAWSLAAEAGNVELATRYSNRSLEILQNADRNFQPPSVARALVFPLIGAWSGGDMEEALRQSQRLTDMLPILPVMTRDLVIEHLFEFSTTLGRIDEAQLLLETLSDPGKRQELQATLLFASGDMGKLKDHFASDRKFYEQANALLMVFSGLPEKARKMHDDLQAQGMSHARSAVIRASVAFGNGDLAAARSELQGAVLDLTLDDQAFYFVGHEVLARTNQADGRLSEAIRILERTTPTRNDAAFNNSGLYWLMCQRQLAQFYRDAGRELEAALVEKDLRKYLLLADNDFPLLSSLDDA
jgi:tetratricopeptide (TPR) repeat protein